MVDSKFFGIPFAVSGDKATIPEDTQPSGAISYQQGYGPDYERDPATDPLAKRVPRDETNELYFQITNALRFLQLYGAPEWYAQDDNGDPVAYPLTARVRYDAGAGMQVWRSLIAANSTVPGANPAHWTLDEPYSTMALEATLAQALTGTSSQTLITPRRLASSVQQGAWNYAVAAGTANNLTATLSPAPLTLGAGFEIVIKITATNTGAATLTLNGLGPASILKVDGSEVMSGDLSAGHAVNLTWNGVAWVSASFLASDVVRPSTPGQFYLIDQIMVPSDVAAVDWKIPSSADDVDILRLTAFMQASVQNVNLRISTNGGSTFRAGATDYKAGYSTSGGTNSFAAQLFYDSTSMSFSDIFDQNAKGFSTVSQTFFRGSATLLAQAFGASYGLKAGVGFTPSQFQSQATASGRTTDLRFLVTSGNIKAGSRIIIEGLST